MKSLPTSLREILASPEVFKVGVGISEDRTKLLKDWSLDLVSWVDLRHLIVNNWDHHGKLGLESLAWLVLGVRLDKDWRIRASDWGAPYRRQTETILTVHLQDINDNRPQFERVNCVGTVSSNVPQGTEVFHLSAVDLDSADRNKIHYRVVSGNEDGCFSLDSKSGNITVQCDLRTLAFRSGFKLNFYLFRFLL